MGDAAGGKTKKSKKHAEDGSSTEPSGATIPSLNTTLSSNSLAPQIVVQGSDGAETGPKSKRSSRASISAGTSKSEEKVKEKSKDKERRKMSKEHSHSSQTAAVAVAPTSPFLHEAEVYKHAGRFKGTLSH
jgi:hypothetical protein